MIHLELWLWVPPPNLSVHLNFCAVWTRRRNNWGVSVSLSLKRWKGRSKEKASRDRGKRAALGPSILSRLDLQGSQASGSHLSYTWQGRGAQHRFVKCTQKNEYWPKTKPKKVRALKQIESDNTFCNPHKTLQTSPPQDCGLVFEGASFTGQEREQAILVK